MAKKKEQPLIVTDLGDGYVRITVIDGYKLYSNALRRVISEAVVKAGQEDKFSAVKA